jgi:predicted nuclease with TOPRIM domain
MEENSNMSGWNEYSRLVLKELETLGEGVESLQTSLQAVRQDISRLESKETKVEELKIWKEKIDDIYSPTQLKDLREKVSSLETFKIRAITIFSVIQFAMAVALFIQSFYK